jgi:pimeloyl-ACP methyl ester carboxylesterase
MAGGMPAIFADLEMHMIPKAGHWAQQEYPREVNARLIDWLQRRFA